MDAVEMRSRRSVDMHHVEVLDVGDQPLEKPQTHHPAVAARTSKVLYGKEVERRPVQRFWLPPFASPTGGDVYLVSSLPEFCGLIESHPQRTTVSPVGAHEGDHMQNLHRGPRCRSSERPSNPAPYPAVRLDLRAD